MLLEKVYGKTCLYSLDAYVREFGANGMLVAARDISELVLPTFDLWRRNAESHANRVIELFGRDQWKLFVRSCEILARLFQNGQLGYCLITGKKTA
jgi:27-O-demethylrifamycin SV methyltransferase